MPEKSDELPLFDCRTWVVPTREEAVNNLIWRELDATKNSVSMAARHYYDHDQLVGKSWSEMQDLLMAKGVNWNDYPTFFKRGSYVQRKRVSRQWTQEELSHLPPEHQAHSNRSLVVERRCTQVLSLPPLMQVTNRVDVVFGGCEALTAKSC